uniref:VWFC domain-containing protein n=1 Tax=Hucho hucho TaxID=62062 RepID=A0A4W5LW19_9TELE
VYRVGSQWEEGCEKCSCTHQQDTHTNLHIAQCVPPVCDHSCPLGSVYQRSDSECCGSCRKTSCVETDRQTPGDSQTHGRLREVNQLITIIYKVLFPSACSALQKYSPLLAFFLFCCITTCNLNGFLFGFHVMDK